MVIQNNSIDKIQIEKMKNITSIEYLDIIQDSLDGNKIYPGFIVSFDNGNYIYITSHDSYFDVFVRKLRDVYLDEKDRVVRESIMGKKGIQIDELTKNILLNGELECVSSFYQMYKNKEGYKERLLFEEDTVKAVFPIIEFHLMSFLKKFNTNISDIKISSGYNGHYYIKALKNNEPIILPVEYSKNGDNYSFQIGNLFNDVFPVIFNVSFLKQMIKLNCYIPEYNYYDYYTYSVNHTDGILENEVFWNDKCISYHKEKIKMIEEVPNIIKKDNSITWYPVSWGGYLGLDDSIDGELHEKRFYYIHSKEDYYFEREISIKEYVDSKKINYPGIVFDSINRTMIGLKEDDFILLENSFSDSWKTGFYKDYLLDKYYYSISLAKRWGDIILDNCTFLDKKMGIHENIDLLETDKIKKKVFKDGDI